MIISRLKLRGIKENEIQAIADTAAWFENAFPKAAETIVGIYSYNYAFSHLGTIFAKYGIVFKNTTPEEYFHKHFDDSAGLCIAYPENDDNIKNIVFINEQIYKSSPNGIFGDGSDSEFQAVLAHEFGHALVNYIERSGNFDDMLDAVIHFNSNGYVELPNGTPGFYASTISKYATTDSDEMMAEAFRQIFVMNELCFNYYDFYTYQHYAVCKDVYNFLEDAYILKKCTPEITIFDAFHEYKSNR